MSRNVLRVALVFLSTFAFAACTEQVMMEGYSEKPISADCAMSALRNSKEFGEVSLSTNEINFRYKVRGFKGSVSHEGDAHSFQNYRIDVRSNGLIGPEPGFIAGEVSELIIDSCGTRKIN